MDPVADDPRAPDFLRQEWIYQVKYSEVSYILQAQLHDVPSPAETNPLMLNPALAWDEQQHPWMDLCEIKIDEPILDREVVSRLDMNSNRSPMCDQNSAGDIAGSSLHRSAMRAPSSIRRPRGAGCGRKAREQLIRCRDDSGRSGRGWARDKSEARIAKEATLSRST